jgi:hypothetical protein
MTVAGDIVIRVDATGKSVPEFVEDVQREIDRISMSDTGETPPYWGI